MKTGLCPMNCGNEGWQQAFSAFGKLNMLMRRRDQDDIVDKMPEVTWVAKPIPVDQRQQIAQPDIDLISGFLSKDGFLATESAAQPINVPAMSMAAAIAEKLLGKCILNQN